ncbi:NAD(P)-binding protein [Saitoella complicata NRRL Y-17804]|uniref:Uncharacterized protein n=1 Tax=Saitoella complicata (strain BCRC 22490 / CBS 7301 / JCM 7358 / NBRC 10748 / NRRL Y-17804) TaxID=698492 RepID=A0A0E9NRZ0_SAICN|nr:NAD(P)-binding protein [Saitoella complicata NRRL Y-17804]ODQ49728.1 NAD(P)-binding protein [Saitoella complicata NRRL Y-17804]GAO52200.1 hypothetical protein G7K_6283-t1 [Saitoella complicata NRRL Y-17804]
MLSDHVDVHGLVTVITGASSGIGLTAAHHLAKQGAILVVADQDNSAVAEAVKKITAATPGVSILGSDCNLTSWEEQAELFDNVKTLFGRVDIVLAFSNASNSGQSFLSPPISYEPRKPDLAVLDNSFSGTLYTINLALHYFRTQEPLHERGHKGTVLVGFVDNAETTDLLREASREGVLALVRAFKTAAENSNARLNGITVNAVFTKSDANDVMLEKLETAVVNRSINGQILEA